MNGKNQTRKQKAFIKNKGYNPNNWLVVKVTPKKLYLKHKVSKKQKELEV